MSITKITRRVTHSSEASIVLYDMPGSTEDDVEQVVGSQRAKCIGGCGLSATCSTYPNEVSPEDPMYQMFGQREDGTATLIDLKCNSSRCEQLGVMEATVELVESLETGNAVIQ